MIWNHILRIDSYKMFLTFLLFNEKNFLTPSQCIRKFFFKSIVCSHILPHRKRLQWYMVHFETEFAVTFGPLLDQGWTYTWFLPWVTASSKSSREPVFGYSPAMNFPNSRLNPTYIENLNEQYTFMFQTTYVGIWTPKFWTGYDWGNSLTQLSRSMRCENTLSTPKS